MFVVFVCFRLFDYFVQDALASAEQYKNELQETKTQHSVQLNTVKSELTAKFEAEIQEKNAKNADVSNKTITSLNYILNVCHSLTNYPLCCVSFHMTAGKADNRPEAIERESPEHCQWLQGTARESIGEHWVGDWILGESKYVCLISSLYLSCKNNIDILPPSISSHFRISDLQDQIKGYRADFEELKDIIAKKEERIEILNNELQAANQLATMYKVELARHNEKHLEDDLMETNHEIVELRKLISHLEDEKNGLENKLKQQARNGGKLDDIQNDLNTAIEKIRWVLCIYITQTHIHHVVHS